MERASHGFAPALAILIAATSVANAQQPDPQQNAVQDTGAKRILWIIPNFRTSPTLVHYEPISIKEKFKIANQDSWDRGTIALAAAFAGQGQISNSNRSFGQG